jgi:hypothetical protein
VPGHRDRDRGGDGEVHGEQHDPEADHQEVGVPHEQGDEPGQQQGHGHCGAGQLQPPDLVTLHWVGAAEPAEHRDHAGCQQGEEHRQHRHGDEVQNG